MKVGKTADISDGGVKKFEVNGEAVAVVNLGGEFFAMNDICTHEQCSLSGGWVEEGKLTCPCHGSQFDVKTGAVDNPPATVPEKNYEVKVESGEIWIKA